MKYSDLALKVLSAKECGIIKSNADFWVNYIDEYHFLEKISENSYFNEKFEELQQTLVDDNSMDGFICYYDSNFPVINKRVTKNSEKPFLLFYKGEISLLSDLNKNVAVIGCIDPTENIINRGRCFVEKLIEQDLVVLSGLALGCDTIGHQVSVENNKKTIAVLPSRLANILPVENRELANNIVEKGGLLITEYYKEPKNKYEAINRYISRDYLQAMFSKSVVLIASYQQGEGDSGSRHAMDAGYRYGLPCYAMFNIATDKNSPHFGLNRELIENKKAQILLPSSILDIVHTQNYGLIKELSLF